MLPACLPNLYVKKYSDLLQPVRAMVFLCASRVSLIKLICYIKNFDALYLIFYIDILF